MSWGKYKFFFVPIEEEITKIDKDDNENVVNMSYKIKFIENARFMASSLSSLLDDLPVGIEKIKCQDYNCCLGYESFKINVCFSIKSN